MPMGLMPLDGAGPAGRAESGSPSKCDYRATSHHHHSQSSMMNDVAPLDRLLTALREHEIPLGRDDVEWAFNSQKTNKGVVEWVDQFLGQETLLSKEEAELYSKLEQKGIVKEILSSQDVATVHPIGDADLRAAIAALQSSTAAIESHTETLKKQRDALNDLVDHDQVEAKARKRTTDKRVKKHISEKQHLDLVVQELSESIRSQLAVLQQRITSSNTALSPSVTELLRKDDKILCGLENLTSKNNIPQHQGEKAKMVEHLCSKLSTLKAEALQCHLDCIYLEERPSPETMTGHNSTDDQAELLSLQEELDSLYSEIGPVAEMAVQQEFLEPIVHAIDEEELEAITQVERRLEYISSTLSYLVIKLDSLTARIEDHQSHASTLQEVSKAAFLEFGSPITERASSPNKSSNPTASPPSYSMIQYEDLTSSQDVEPHWQLLKSLGVHKSRKGKADELDGILSAEIAERNEKLSSSIESLDSSIVSALAAHVGDADMALQLLQDALYADSQYHDVHLSHAGSTAEMDSLDQQLSDLGKGMGELDLEVLHQPDKKREQFIERWSG
ncbi:MAG: hypothetical protein M1812_001307 [Candelaria pacifica]|nr:MAG: hypothetical protein M1812_001307 [Candelaria pacifica]